MKRRPSESSPSPAVHSENIRQQLTELIKHVEADTGRVEDSRFRGLLQKSAEVLKNLRTLFERFPTSGSPAMATVKQPAPGRSKTEVPRQAAPSTKGNSTGAGRDRSKSTDARPAIAETKGSAQAKVSAKAGGKPLASQAKSSRSAATPAKGEKASRQNADSKSNESHEVSAQSNPAPANTTKPEDPAAQKAKLEIQRKEARAPMMPPKSAPKMMPPQSGKPVWDRPHSS